MDKRSGKVMDIRLAPLFWLPGHNADTAIGSYPGKGTMGMSLSEKETLMQDYYVALDALLDSAK